VKKVQVGRNVATTYTVGGGHVPAADKVDYVESEGSRKISVGSIQITQDAMDNAKSTRGAVIRIIDSEMRGLMGSMETMDEFFFSRDGTATVTTLGSVTNTAAAYATTPLTVDDARGIWEKASYQIRDATTPTTVHAEFTCARVPRALSGGEAQVYLTGDLAALGQADGDFITWGAGVNSAYGNAVTGLDVLIDDAATTFQGINVSTYPRYSSIVMDNGGTTQNLTPSLLRNMLAALAQEQAADSVGNLLVYTSVWDNKNFEEMYEGELRIAPDTRIGGIKVPTFQSVFGTFSVMTAPYCQYGTMFFIDRNEIAMPIQRPLDWLPGSVQGIFIPSYYSGGTLALSATAMETKDLMIFDRRKCGKIQNLSVTPSTAY